MAHSKRLVMYVKSLRGRNSSRCSPVACGASPCDPKSVKMMILARVDDRLSVHPRECLSMILNAHDEGFQALCLDWSGDLGQETSGATWPFLGVFLAGHASIGIPSCQCEPCYDATSTPTRRRAVSRGARRAGINTGEPGATSITCVQVCEGYSV